MHESESNALVATNWWWRKGHKSLQMSMDIRLFNVFNAGFHFVDTEAAQGPSESVKPGCGDIVLLAVVPATTLQIVATCVSTLIVLDVATLDTVLTVEMQYVTNVMSYGTVAANGDCTKKVCGECGTSLQSNVHQRLLVLQDLPRIWSMYRVQWKVLSQMH